MARVRNPKLSDVLGANLARGWRISLGKRTLFDVLELEHSDEADLQDDYPAWLSRNK